MLKQAEYIEFLISRLERLSADSHWAHRASGVRGALLRLVESRSGAPAPILPETEIEKLLSAAYELLVKAAREIPDLENDLKIARQKAASQVK